MSDMKRVDTDPEKEAASRASVGTGADHPKEGDLIAPPTASDELLHRKLKGRHMQMIAIGGSIGTGLFVGSGSALQSGGPASLVIGELPSQL